MADQASLELRGAVRSRYAGAAGAVLEYLAGLSAAGLADATVTFAHEPAPGMHSAIIQATRPA